MNNKCCPKFDKSNIECNYCKHEEENREITAKMIILECESFYQTFKLLELYFIKKEQVAGNFILDEELCEKKALYTYSYIVNGAFATELAIKYLLTMANIDYCTGEKGHNLLDLYEKLLLKKGSITSDKKIIVERLCAEGYQDEDTILINLKSIQDCYNRFRYCFSHNSVGFNNFFNVFVNVICSYAIDKAKSLEGQI